MLVGSVLGFVPFSVASLWTDAYSWTLGILLRSHHSSLFRTLVEWGREQEAEDRFLDWYRNQADTGTR